LNEIKTQKLAKIAFLKAFFVIEMEFLKQYIPGLKLNFIKFFHPQWCNGVYQKSCCRRDKNS